MVTDPELFSSVTFKTSTKKIAYYGTVLFEGTFTSFFRDKKSHKTEGINVFFTIFA
jgi:hypothetical protein